MSADLHVVIRALPSGQVVVDDEGDSLSLDHVKTIVKTLVPAVSHAWTTGPGEGGRTARGRRHVFERAARPQRLTPTMQTMLDNVRHFAQHATSHNPGILVSGQRARTAEALSRRGLVSLQYQGGTMYWVKPA